jgi:predicted NBD/HSP70 family sugar kinase
MNAPVYIENDTAVVGLGEAVFGAGKFHDIVAYISVSTGVGGVRIVHKQIDVSAAGFEPGHQIIDAGGGLEVRGEPAYQNRTLEAYVSGSSVEARYHKKPFEIEQPEFWEHMARILAYGLNNTIVHWSPEIVVIGGSMMKKIGIPVDRVAAHLKGILHIYPEIPVIAKSELEDVGGLYGAMQLIKTRKSSNCP